MDVISEIGKTVLWCYMALAPLVSLAFQGMYDVDRMLRHRHNITNGLKFLRGELWNALDTGLHWLPAILWAALCIIAFLSYGQFKEDMDFVTFLLFISGEISTFVGCITLLAIPLLMWKVSVFMFVKMYVARNK